MLPGPEPGPSSIALDWSLLKDAVKRFERAWRREPRHEIDDYLPDEPALRFRVLVELVHIDLELRLKAGQAARAEEYLSRYPSLADDRATALELIAAEYELRRRSESGLAIDDYLQRFPEYRVELMEDIAHLTVDCRNAPIRSNDPREMVTPAVAGYEVLGLLGRGGMGVVYKARQHSLDRPVALKFLPEECARDPIWLARFRREARTASALNHPHICTIYDTGESDGRPFLSMELIEGRTLEGLIRQRQPIEELARLLRQAAQALGAAHAAGVVHRDVKPANVMVRDDGIVKVLDFGLAHRLRTMARQGTVPESKGSETDTRVGTLLYMSPEQARAEPVDAATDIFSLGLVLYELATGQHPFLADSQVGVLHAIVAGVQVPPSRLNPEVPSSLDTLIQHMLAKDPRHRPAAIEVEAALTQLSVKVSPLSSSQLDIAEKRPMVGRQHEWAALRFGFEEAAAGRGSVLCVTGEPGLGKTTLVERFLEELATSGRASSLARGRCSERLAGAEAYLPFLEALDCLLHGDGGASAAHVMKLVAPAWYVHLAPLAADEQGLARVFAEAKEASQERRKRELGVFFHEWSRLRPLVLFLDDIHWADASSVDLLAYLGSRCAGLRLLLVLTYRPSELLLNEHPFGPIKLELQGRGVCREISLPFLSRDDFDRYLALAFSEHQFPNELAMVLHARTEGNPLFMVDLLRYMRDRGVIVQERGCWMLARAVPDLQRELPESVRSMVQRKVDQLGMADRHLLMAASVQGSEFDSAVMAKLLGRDAEEVEERLAHLERVHYLVRLVRVQTFPDGKLTVRYIFVHALYQNAFYAALQPTRKAAWSAAAAWALLGHYGEKSATLATELAMLFEAARDHERSADHYRMATENAAHIYAHHEAVALARRGLTVLQKLPDIPDRARRELSLLLILGMQLQIAQGYAVPEAERIYNRAHSLCAKLQDAVTLFTVLWGQWMFREVGCELSKSRELGERLLALAQKTRDPAHLLQARVAVAVTSLCLGEPAATREHVDQGFALYVPKRHSSHHHLYGQEPGVACLAFGGVAYWLLGYPDEAVRRNREAVALSGKLGQPISLALALYFAAMLRQYRREVPAVLGSAEAITAISTEYGFSFWLANGLLMTGWALAEQGSPAGGIAKLRQGMAAFAATGAGTYRTYSLALLAEALGRHGQIEEGLVVLSDAINVMQDTGEAFHGAELHRLLGEFLLRPKATEIGVRKAEACFHRALALARQQQAKSLELRAAMSLTRLYQKLDRHAEARPLLAECFNWFTEGFDTPDLLECKALLEQLA